MTAAPAAARLAAEDAGARRAAQCEFSRPLLLEAGAGTGKTTALVARVVAWAVGEGWRQASLDTRAAWGWGGGGSEVSRVAARVMDGIVAVTFTEAAAAQMARRVGEVLVLLSRGEPVAFLDGEILHAEGEVLAERAAALVERLDRLQVTTIHSYCRRLLASWPYEARLHPEFSVDADESATRRAVQLAVERVLRQEFASDRRDDLLALAAAGNGGAELVEAAAAMVRAAMPAAALADDPYSLGVVRALRDELEREVAAFVAGAGAALAAGARGKAARQVLTALADLRQALERVGPVESVGVAPVRDAVAACTDGGVQTRLEKWADGEFTASEAEALGEAASSAAAAAARLVSVLARVAAADAELLASARRVLQPMVDAVYQQLRREGVETFHALLVDARALLRRHPEVAAQERGRIRQLLVDEFQDTDGVQCDIVRILALEGPADARPGLFLVGDPKQSIYGWRNADLAAYQRFVDDLVAAGGQVMHLSVNYRSVQPILDEVQRCIEPAMVPEPGVQPPFRPLVAHRGGGAPGTVPAVEFWISWLRADDGAPKVGNVAATAALEGRAVAADIRQRWDAGELEPGRTALLFRAMSDVEVYLDALREAGVPYAVQRDASFFQRREIVDAASLVRAVVDPADHVALVGWLRSPSVGVPDAAWLPLWRHGFLELATVLGGDDAGVLAQLDQVVAEVAGELPADIPGLDAVAGWELSLRAALADLEVLRRSFRTEAADVFVETLRTRTLLEASEAARYLGAFRLANLERFFSWLLDTLERQAGNPFAVLRILRTAVAEEPETAETRPPDRADDAVQVLTIHGAKGLDFDHVYLLQTHKRVQGKTSRAHDAEWLDEGWEYRLFGVPSAGWERVEARRQRVRRAELVRLAYVALTRARDRLVVCGAWPREARRRAPTSLAEVLAQRTPTPDLEALFADARAAGGAVEAGGVRWVFPALLPIPAPHRQRPDERRHLPSLAAIAEEAERLAAERVSAATRMARPFGAAASAEAHRLLALEEADMPAASPGVGGRDAALAFGTAVHRALETLDLALPWPEGLVAAGRYLEQELARQVEGEELALLMERARQLLQRLASSAIGQRLASLGDSVVARELPLLLPPNERGAVGFVAGAADLVFRDPASGALVVADYKTDEVEGEEEIAARAALYASQGGAYVRGVAAALGLDDVPRFELWFLWPGRIVVVDCG